MIPYLTFLSLTDALAHKTDAYQDGPCRPPAACVDSRWWQRSEPELQLNEILPGSTDKPSLGKVSSPNLLPAAPGIVEEQDPQRTSHASKPVPKSSVPKTGAPLAKSHSLSRISIGVCWHFHPISLCFKC